MKLDIMGVSYELVEHTQTEDKRLENCDGYCDWTTHTLVVEREITGTLADMDAYVKKVKRHEITHAFLMECGLSECSYEPESWARNEEMVDWFSRIGPRIYAAWQAAGAL